MPQPQLTAAELTVQQRAVRYAKDNKKRIVAARTALTTYPADTQPISIFMAGSAGAGKTEASKQLLNEFIEQPILRIDPDDLRAEFTDYVGSNSYLFQYATSILVECIHNAALKKRQSFIFDSTFSHLEKARQNIHRSLKRQRTVLILYVYQPPEQAWRFVQARENLEGRRVAMEVFIQQYFSARAVVNALKADFGNSIELDLLRKNVDGTEYLFNDIEKIDNHVPEEYAQDTLKPILLSI